MRKKWGNKRLERRKGKGRKGKEMKKRETAREGKVEVRDGTDKTKVKARTGEGMGWRS